MERATRILQLPQLNQQILIERRNIIKAPKKIGKAIAKKFKNWKGTTASKETTTDRTQEPSASSSTNKDLPGEVEKQKLLEVFKKEMIIEHLDGREENHTILTDAISRKDSRAVREVLKLSEEYGILEEILNKKIIIKQADGQERSYTSFDYANENCKEIVKIIEKFKGDSNIPTKDTAPITDNIEVVSTGLEDINKGSKDLNIHQSICESSGETKNDTTQIPNISDISSSIEVEPCFDNDTANEGKNSSTKTTQQRQAILAGFIGTALLVSSVALCIMEMYVVAVVGGIVGLACVGFVLYNAMKPNTELEKVKDI